MKTEKLPKAFKKKWVDALLSGRYEQGSGQLKSSDAIPKHCCMGVAGEVSGCSQMINRGYLEIGAKIIGLDNVPELLLYEIDNPIPYQLATLNDAEVPFEVIAGVINEYL